MKTKIKYEQYLVRGKHHRQYHILKLPTPEYAWLYEAPPEDGEVALDGDETVFREIGIAMSLLMVNPTKIIYLPKAKNKNCYFRRRELVITRQELQLRRSEWVALRRQISRRTRIENYDDNYDYSEFCISNKFTYKPGNIQLWVEVLNAEKKLVAKSSIATIRIKPHIGVEEIIPEQGLSLIESMRMRLDELEGYINLLKANQLFMVEKDNDGGGE